jgi:hypothetical protein
MRAVAQLGGEYSRVPDHHIRDISGKNQGVPLVTAVDPGSVLDPGYERIGLGRRLTIEVTIQL